MRFFPCFTWGASSPSSERRLSSHDRSGAQSGVQSDGPLARGFSRRAIPRTFDPEPEEFDRIPV
jgi:hypothetical protein